MTATLLLTASASLALGSVLFFVRRGAPEPAILLLTLAAFVLRLFAASLDPFLHQWDEQYHALVAKNLLLHPFRPTLYEAPVLPFDYRVWTESHVWLHKQPLTLWQMAASLRVFGLDEVAVRLPSALLSALLVPLTYRIGQLLIGAPGAYYAAFFCATSAYQLGLVSGRIPLDHVDVAFTFYVTASFWALAEYTRRPRPVWAAACGCCAGLAVLVKWLVGLVAFGPWLVMMVIPALRPPSGRWSHFVGAGITALVIAVPWQAYTLAAFPEVARNEIWYNSLHMYQVVEGHGGDLLFHLRHLPDLYGKVGSLLLPPALALLWFRVQAMDRVLWLTPVLVVYGLFSFAATKMPSYTLVVSAFFYVALGALLAQAITLLERIRRPTTEHFLITAGLCALAYFGLNVPKMIRTADQYAHLAQATRAYRAQSLGPHQGRVVLVECPEWYAAAAMFFSGLTAYDRPLTAAERSHLRSEGLVVEQCVHLPEPGPTPENPG